MKKIVFALASAFLAAACAASLGGSRLPAGAEKVTLTEWHTPHLVGVWEGFTGPTDGTWNAPMSTHIEGGGRGYVMLYHIYRPSGGMVTQSREDAGRVVLTNDGRLTVIVSSDGVATLMRTTDGRYFLYTEFSASLWSSSRLIPGYQLVWAPPEVNENIASFEAWLRDEEAERNSD